MHKGRKIVRYLLLLTALLHGCAFNTVKSDNGKDLWLVNANNNSNSSESTNLAKDDATNVGQEKDDKTNKTFTTEEMVAELISDSTGKLYEMIWEHQRLSASRELSQQIQKKKNLITYYFSSSEGNDNNSGLTSDKPKKNMNKYSGVSNINILLKSGDIFQMESTFYLGNNVVFSFYGEGARPVLNYYQELNVTWYKSGNYKNVWKADLSNIRILNKGSANQSDYDIGQLLIDGEYNWKRIYNSEWGGKKYSEYLKNTADGSWGIDWINSTVYLYDKKNPNKREISYALPAHGVYFNNVKDVYMMGLEIKGAAFHGVCLSGAENIVIKNSYIHHIGGGFLKGTATRYGNAIEVWDHATNLEISYNIAEWIFDTCFTNQGNGKNITQKNVVFRRNIGRFSFWGMESWGDAFSEAGFENIRYEENILMNACDVTAPEIQLFSNNEGRNLDASGSIYEKSIPYHTYRSGDYPFSQMALISASSGGNKNSLIFCNNVLWGTNRFLSIIYQRNTGLGYPEFYNNLFYSEVPVDSVCSFRYTVLDGSKKYYKKLPIEANQSVIVIKEKENKYAKLQAVKVLKSAVKKIMTGE